MIQKRARDDFEKRVEILTRVFEETTRKGAAKKLPYVLMHKVTREKSTLLINAIIKTRRSRGHTFHFDFVLLIALSFHYWYLLFFFRKRRASSSKMKRIFPREDAQKSSSLIHVARTRS